MQPAARVTKRLALGPEDAGRRLTWNEFHSAKLLGAFRYELIDGRLEVSPPPNPKRNGVSEWIYGELLDYKRAHPEIFNALSSHCEIVIPGRPDVTAPQPDLAAYCDFPTDRIDDTEFTWRDVAPILVVEIVSPDTAQKDLERNVELYELEPTIREYWIIDPRPGINNRTMRIYRRRGAKWQKPINIGPGGEYTTKLLPGFCLRLDPLA